ncbi:MAG: hypothetical protein AAF810_17740 [Cyanobacteria bacterium P01_D01_bin.36]
MYTIHKEDFENYEAEALLASNGNGLKLLMFTYPCESFIKYKVYCSEKRLYLGSNFDAAIAAYNKAQ